MTSETAPTLHSVAAVTTDKPSRYLQQLCKHFAHKRPVEFTPEQGSIRFDFGQCSLAASDTVLRMEVSAASVEDLDRMRNVIASHLLRFAFREPPEVVWS